MMRIQLELEDTGLIDRLKHSTGVKTHKDLFNNAVTLLAWAVRQVERGRIVASVNEKTEDYRELQMPALEHAASLSRREEEGFRTGGMST